MSKAPVGTSGSASEGGYNAGIAVFSYIVGGILVWSLIGWCLDILFDSSWIVLVGALVGVLGGFYLAYAHRLFHRAPKAGDSGSGVSRVGAAAPEADSKH